MKDINRKSYLLLLILLICGTSSLTVRGGANQEVKKITIQGVVTDKSGGALPGITVAVADEALNTSTDLEGKYQLSNVPADAALLFSYIGMATKRVDVSEQTEINVVMSGENLHAIQGVVRDATTRKPLLGAKVQSKNRQYSAMTNEEGFFTIQVPEYLNQLYLSASDYAEVEYPLQGKTEIDVSLYPALPPLRNPLALTADTEIQSLLGGDIRVIAHSGTPAIGASLFIRGYNSLNAGSQPLIVLDGMIFDNQYDRASIHDGFILNPLSNISVDDIESFQVIKDGTSLYGAKGGNGVLLINTKRGKDPVTQITFSSLLGYNEAPKTMPTLDAGQFRVFASDVIQGAVRTPEVLSSEAFLNDNPLYYDYLRYHNNNDWSKNVYRNSYTQSYNIGVSGGDAVALYHLSLGYANANSTLKANDFSRFNARFNSDVDLTQHFRISFDLSYAQTDRNLRNDGLAETQDVITSPSVLALIKAPLLIPYEYSNTGAITSDLSDADVFNVSNPVAIIENGIGESSQNYLTLSVRPIIRFNEALKLSGSFNYALSSLFEKYFRPNAGVPTVVVSAVGLNAYLPSESFAKAQNTRQISIAAGLDLNWKKQFTGHTFDLSGGARFLSDAYTGEFGSGHNSATDLEHNLDKSLSYKETTGYDEQWRSLSWYANAGYSLYDKYSLSAVLTADASSRFGQDADLLKIAGVRWGIFPSAHLEWLLSSENFMRNLPLINLLKLRLGYGLSGNDNIPNASALTYFSTIRYINPISGISLANIGNRSLKMETVEKKDLGVDLSLFNNRLSLSADVFHHVTSDLLTLKQFNYLAGMDNYWSNGGKLENKGYELTINAKALAFNHFQWEIGGSLTHYENKILELPDGDYTTAIYGGEIKTAIGQPAALFYGYKTEGVLSNTPEALAANLKILDATGASYTSFAAGDMRFADLHPDGIIDEQDKTIIGDPNPDFTGSFNSRFVYKNLSLSALFTFSYGNDTYNYLRSQLEAGNNYHYNQSAAMQNRWVSEGQRTSIPQSAYGDPMGNSRFSDRWIEDGSYLRLKSLSVAYTIPVNWIFLSGFTIWASANNLWTYSKYLGADPEFSISNSILYQGIDAGLLSQGRSYFIGLKLNL
jgi:TonB-linked SusC/RagA family outer membrane protein